MFGPKQPVILHLWDSPDLRCTIEFLVSELMDSAMPPLEDIRIINDPQTAFENIDVAIMLDSLEFEDVTTFKNRIDQCVGVYKSIGEALEMKGKQTIKVIVAGNPVNINTFIMSRYAPSISKSCFSGLLRVDHNRALVQVRNKFDKNAPIRLQKNWISLLKTCEMSPSGATPGQQLMSTWRLPKLQRIRER